MELMMRTDLCLQTLDALVPHVAVLDEAGQIVLTNAAWRRFAEANQCESAQVSEGANYLTVCDSASGPYDNEAPSAASAIRSVLSGLADEQTLEYPCHSPETERWFIMRVTRFEERGHSYAVVTHQDITSRHQAEARTRAAEERFHTLFQAAPDAMLLTNAHGTITLVNSQAERMFGYSRAELVGQPVDTLVSLSDLTGPGHTEGTSPGTAGSLKPVSMRRRRALRHDGSELVLEISLSPVVSARDSGVIAAIRDVSERQRLENQLQQAQKMEIVGRLAGGIAHDFNNLLSVINATADLAQLDIQEDSPLKLDLVTIRSAGERAAALTQQLLAFSRKQIVRPVPVELGALIYKLEPILQRLVGEHIRIAIRAPRGIWPALIDPVQAEQVLLNLAANARDAMPQGGTLTIELANQVFTGANGRRRVDVQPGPYVVLSVRDTGVGMDEDTRSRIFEPFFTTKGVKGTGLGLATVFGIAKQCDGDVWCESTLGRGTAFHVVLPRTTDGTGATTDTPAETVHGRATILVVEDDDNLREVARRILASAGFQVRVAAGGEEALDLLRNTADEISLVLTDVVMPGMSGRELADQIARIVPNMTIVFTSGYTDDAVVREGVAVDSLYFVRKPYSVGDLVAKISEALSAVDPDSRTSGRPVS